MEEVTVKKERKEKKEKPEKKESVPKVKKSKDTNNEVVQSEPNNSTTNVPSTNKILAAFEERRTELINELKTTEASVQEMQSKIQEFQMRIKEAQIKAKTHSAELSRIDAYMKSH